MGFVLLFVEEHQRHCGDKVIPALLRLIHMCYHPKMCLFGPWSTYTLSLYSAMLVHVVCVGRGQWVTKFILAPCIVSLPPCCYFSVSLIVWCDHWTKLTKFVSWLGRIYTNTISKKKIPVNVKKKSSILLLYI